MFKKFKDKLAEEMKQSPARLQASMQQLAQAVVSPALSNSSIQELSASNDNFSLTEEGDETPKNSPARHGFQSINLTSPASNSHGMSRRSSVSSLASVDAASIFPIYENPGNMYHLQSDAEQSASEVEENISPQLDRVSKDQLYTAYRKVQTKYHKYRGRYTDLANHYREMERVKGKLESLLVETQDKALRRIADLKEQCQLEQQAKAHLEEALRNDIEEKDHVIDTLNTKVRLLQTGGSVADVAASSATSLEESQQNQRVDELIDVSTEVTPPSPPQPSESETSNLAYENTQLKSKLEKLESLITKYKESLKRNKEKMTELSEEKSIIERDFESSRNSSTERFAQLEEDLKVARNEILNVRDQMTAMKKREEESVISLAENKWTIHRELEVKEEQIKELGKELKSARETRESLEESVERYKAELERLRMSSDESTDAEKTDLVRDLSKGKTEALKLMQKEMQRRVIELEETMGVKCHEEEAKNRELIDKLERREEDLRSFERETIELRKEAENYREKCEALRNELSTIKDKEYRDEIGNRSVDSKRNEAAEQQQQQQQSESEEKGSESEITGTKAEKKYSEEQPHEAEETCGQVEKATKLMLLQENCQEKGVKDSNEVEKGVDNRYAVEGEKLREELSRLKIECNALRAESEGLRENSREKEEEKDETIRQLNTKVELYATAIQKARKRLEEQQSEINGLRGNSELENELTKLREDSENKSVEILGIASELKSCKTTTNDLREKIRSDAEKIDLLTKEKICLISNVLEYKTRIAELKRSCDDVRTSIKGNDQSRNDELARIRQIVATNFEKYSSAQAETSEREIQRSKAKLLEELEERNEEISAMREKVDRCDEINHRNKKLIAEIDGLNFKIFDLEKLRTELDETKINVENLKSENLTLRKSSGEESGNWEKIVEENLTKLRDLESANEELKKRNQELVELNSRIKLHHENERKNLEEKSCNLASELSKFKCQLADERRNEEERSSIADMELSRMKSEHENHEKLVADYAEKLKYFEAECAKRDTGLEELRVAMDKREKMLEETIERSKNFQLELSKISREKSSLESELENREKLASDGDEKLRSFQSEISKLAEEKSRLASELENRESLMANSVETLKNVESQFSKLSEEKSRLASELENRESLMANSVEKLKNVESQFSKLSEEKSRLEADMEKLKSFEVEFSNLSAVKSNLEAQLENREKSLEDVTEKLKNLENEFSILSRKDSENETELENRERTLRETIEKSKNTEAEFVKLCEEKSKLAAELENREKLFKDNGEKLINLENDFSKLSKEKSEISIELESLRTASTELEGSSEALKETINSKNALLKKLKALKERQAQTIQSSATKILELEAKLSELEAERRENSELVSKISELETVQESLQKDIREFEEKTLRITEEKEKHEKINEDLRKEISETSSLREELEEISIEYKESKVLCNELEKTNGDLEKLKQDTEKKLEEMERICTNRMDEIVNFKSEITKRDEELKRLGENSGQRLEDLEEMRKKLEEDFRNRADKLEDEYMEKYRDRELEVKRFNDELKSKLEEKDAELRTKLTEERQEDDLRELVQQLQNQMQDKESKLLSSQTKGSQIQIFNEELKSQVDKLKRQMETNEAEQSMRLKQLVKEFQAQLHDKDEELQAALDKRFESQQNYESDLIQQYREQLKDFQVELTVKSEEIERLIIEKKEENASKSREMEKLIETIGNIKQEHANELREIERKWKATIKQRSDQLEAKHEEDVSELTREWQNERRNDDKATDESPEELESTSRVAMAAVQSNTGSLHSLQQTLVSQRRELAELRKIVKLRQDTLEDSTEIEYLRNILYEYMMGRETVVLARVIAAVVKFDQEQTTKILKKEEDKLTLLGSLGLS